MHGAVIGAGLAGISTTHALRRIGLTVDLFEQAPQARSTGYQLNVWTNGKYALGQIGLLDALKVSGHGVEIRAIVLMDGRTGKVVGRLAPRPFEGYEGTSFYRSDLHKASLPGLRGEPSQYGRTVESVTDDYDRRKVSVGFSNGEVREFDFVIGADGRHSKIRRHLFPEHRGFVPCFDALLFGVHVDLQGKSAAERLFAEQVGNGEFVQIALPGAAVVLSAAGSGRFGVIMPMADARRARGISTPEDAKAIAMELVRGVRNPRVHHAIDSAFWEWGNPLVWHIGDIDRLPSFHVGRVALTGDAAHATVPGIGQGANQAFEDAMVLVRHIGSAEPSDIGSALARYSAERRPHVVPLQERGRRMVRMALPSGRVGHWLSNTVTRLRFTQRMFVHQWNELLQHAIADPLCPIEAAP